MLSHFDYLFSNFSTAASCSGPAAIRVLRASCGQEAHADLYKSAPQQCHLFSQLASAGYTVQTLLNHDGHFDNFLQIVHDNIGVPDAPMVSNAAAPVAMHAFDGSAIKDDYSTLANWYAQRASVPGPVALYYNTISLHDGNRVVGSALTSIDSYPQRATKLMNDFDHLANLIAQSGRRAVIVFVPEHGAALRGDHNQVAGLRDLDAAHHSRAGRRAARRLRGQSRHHDRDRPAHQLPRARAAVVEPRVEQPVQAGRDARAICG
jgi:cellulose synthase operon protein YhjU